MPARALWGSLLAACAVVLIAVSWAEYFTPIASQGFWIALQPAGAEAVVTRVAPEARTGVKPGDTILLSQMTMSERLRLRMSHSPAGWTMTIPVMRDGREMLMQAQSVFRVRPTSLTQEYVVFSTTSTIAIAILGLVAWRRPSIATVALLFYGAGTMTSGGIAALFSWLPDPAYGVAGVIISLFGELPNLALLVFITRFPELPQSAAGRLRMHVGDGIFIFFAVVSVLEGIYEPVLYRSWTFFDVWATAGTVLVVLAFAVFAYLDASGNDRRRIGWVIAGFVVSIIASSAFNIFLTTSGNLVGWSFILDSVLALALPVALAYAVLRHRVIDLGFAINRTVVYAAIVGIVIALVGVVDWLVSKLIGEQRLAGAVEALLTIAIGFALTFIHRWVERVVDRIVFRQRHIAEKQIACRIDALDFSESERAVDEALVHDVSAILRISSAAVFRRLDSSAAFVRTASLAWPVGTLESADGDALLVRTMRVVERPVFLDDVAIALPDAPTGRDRPAFAIPIVTQHELLGFVLYGNHEDGSSPDPDEIALLHRLARAAGAAYGTVEARRWRERATVLERSLLTQAPSLTP
jgi:hypothetical protein